jgi:hypothetical protein
MHVRSRDSIIFAGCRMKEASALTVRKFPYELRLALRRYGVDKEFTQEEALITLLREALDLHHYWQPLVVDTSHRRSDERC